MNIWIYLSLYYLFISFHLHLSILSIYLSSIYQSSIIYLICGSKGRVNCEMEVVYFRKDLQTITSLEQWGAQGASKSQCLMCVHSTPLYSLLVGETRQPFQDTNPSHKGEAFMI